MFVQQAQRLSSKSTKSNFASVIFSRQQQYIILLISFCPSKDVGVTKDDASQLLDIAFATCMISGTFSLLQVTFGDRDSLDVGCPDFTKFIRSYWSNYKPL